MVPNPHGGVYSVYCAYRDQVSASQMLEGNCENSKVQFFIDRITFSFPFVFNLISVIVRLLMRLLLTSAFVFLILLFIGTEKFAIDPRFSTTQEGNTDLALII